MKKFKIMTAVAAGVLASSMASAATDGTLGTSSDGVFTATLTVNDLVVIDGMADLTIDGSAGQDDGSGNFVATDAVCIFTNSATGFSIDVSSVNDFNFANDPAPTPTHTTFDVALDVDSDGTAEGTFSANADAAVNFNTNTWNAFTVGTGCDSTADGTSDLSLIVSQTEYFAAPASGTDTVTVTITAL